MKKLMVCAVALAAGVACAEGESKGGYPSLLRCLGQGLDSYKESVVKIDFDEENPDAFGNAVESLYEKANPIVAAVPAQDADLAYKFTMNLKVVENSHARQIKVTDFVEDYSDGNIEIYYFASTKRTIKGSIWVQARPSVVLGGVLNTFGPVLEEELEAEGWGFADAFSSFGNLAGLLTEVRGVAMWDAKTKKYLTPTLFGMGGVAMGKDGKEAFGGFLSVFGANFQKLAVDAPDYLQPIEEFDVEGGTNVLTGRYEFDWNKVCPHAGEYFGEDVGLAMGLGVGKNNFNAKSGNYIKSLNGTCFWLSSKSITTTPGLFFDAKGSLPMNKKGTKLDGDALVEQILTGLTGGVGPFGVFYNAYTAEPYPLPLDVSVGFGTWKLAANAGSIKKFAQCTTDAEKVDYFLNKTGLLKVKVGKPITLDMLKLILDVALLGDSGAKAAKWFEGRKEQLDKYIAYANKNGLTNELAMAEVDGKFYDLLIDYCKVAEDLGVKDSSAKPMDVQKIGFKKSSEESGEKNSYEEARAAMTELDEYRAHVASLDFSKMTVGDATGYHGEINTRLDYARKTKEIAEKDGFKPDLNWDTIIANAEEMLTSLQQIIEKK